MSMKKWTEEELEILRLNFPISSKKEMETILTTRTYQAMRTRATLIGIKKAVGFGSKKYWNADELAYIKIHYSETENGLLCKKFNCSLKSVYTAAQLLGVKKSKEYRSRTFGSILKEVGKSTRFNPGRIPENKGRKWNEFMSKESQESCRKTTFKKGSIPHNIVEIGHERITRDGYIEVKIGDFSDSTKNFKLKHRMIWESANGPVPDGYQVRFIDGNPLNFELSNLKLVSKHESLLINSMSDASIVKRFMGIKDEKIIDDIIDRHQGLISLKRNAIKLNQQIKQNERKA